MPLIRDRGSSVQRGRSIVGVLLGACLLLAGCGRPLVGIPTENSAARTVGSATPGVPNEVVVAAGEPAAGTSEAASIAAVPEASAAAVENTGAAPAANTGAMDGAETGSAVTAAETPPPAVPTPEPTINPAFGDVKLPGAEERWRYVQQDRVPLQGHVTYTTPSREILWWYDPLLGRTIRLGEIQGDFPVQATFRFRGQEVDALEVPYQINSSFGITLPAPTVEAIRQAGYTTDWIEAFVYKTEDIRPK